MRLDGNDNKCFCYISSLMLSEGMRLELTPSDIVVFVGPNNVGKSQALTDIYNKTTPDYPTVVVKDIRFEKDFDELDKYIASISKEEKRGSSIFYTGYGYRVDKSFLFSGFADYLLESLRDFFVANLNTINRLTICSPPSSFHRGEAPQHPIQYAVLNEDAKMWLSENFARVFGEGIIPNYLYGSIIPLCIGPQIGFNSEIDGLEKQIDYYVDRLEKYKQVHSQGDGIKSFVGILLYLMIDRYSVYLIDEPESFLHPPQAKIMGVIIADAIRPSQQAFISTHSEDIVKGLLYKASDRVKIVRITRTGDNNQFSVLQNTEISEIWRDPLLRHSNILSAMFHKTVILCESDSDCQMYSLIDEYLESQRGRYSERLYIHCGGKHRIATVVKALKAISVEVKTIVDLDVLNDKKILQGIVEAFGANWSSFEKDYDILDRQMETVKDQDRSRNVREQVLSILNKSSKPQLNDDEIVQINALMKRRSKWERVKNYGVNGVPSGEATQAFNKLMSGLKSMGIYMVPVGELENFVKDVGDHGPKWVNNVLEKYPSFSSDIYKSLKEFMEEVFQN